MTRARNCDEVQGPEIVTWSRTRATIGLLDDGDHCHGGGCQEENFPAGLGAGNEPTLSKASPTCVEWDIIWKSLGGIMVNGVPREVPRPKPEGPQRRGEYSAWQTL